MRIPFDLIAAVLLMDAILQELLGLNAAGQMTPMSAGVAAGIWAGFLLAVWLVNELVTRDTEWRTRFGLHPAGTAGKRHPLEIFSWATRAAQALTVALYGGILWTLQWPLATRDWPTWFGMNYDAKIGSLYLADSSVVAMVLNLGPFLVAMLLSWLPRRRLFAGLRRRPVSLRQYISLEARLTWAPLVLWLLIAVLQDGLSTLPRGYTHWLHTPGVTLAVSLLSLVVVATVVLPQLVIWLWDCRPLPDGELKQRLLTLMERSGVKARSILVWGTRGSGLLNAAVLGPWAPLRYVLISPQLVDELTMEETEAVLAHELGHARYGHLSLLLLMLLSMTALLDPILQVLPPGANSPLAQSGVLVVFVILYMWGFFGRIMRQCEREADLASAELLGTATPLVSALEKLANLGGNIRNVYSWHHGSIADRVDSVTRLSIDPGSSAIFHQQQRRIRLLFAAMTLAAIGMQCVLVFRG